MKAIPKPLDLSVVIPVYNESSCIKKVAEEWRNALIFQKISFQIIFINDGSTDNTKDILENLSASLPEIKVINQQNGGHGNALISGYHEAIADNSTYTFQVDSDDQFLPEDFHKVWKLKNESPFVLGIRSNRNDPVYRILISKFLKYSLSILCKTSIADANIPYRLIQTKFLQSALHCMPIDAFAPNVFLSIISAKYLKEFPQVPVTHIERRTGQVSIIRFSLLKACVRSFFEIIRFSSVLDHKVARMQLELEETNENAKAYA